MMPLTMLTDTYTNTGWVVFKNDTSFCAANVIRARADDTRLRGIESNTPAPQCIGRSNRVARTMRSSSFLGYCKRTGYAPDYDLAQIMCAWMEAERAAWPRRRDVLKAGKPHRARMLRQPEDRRARNRLKANIRDRRWVVGRFSDGRSR